jgi:RHS repeat-associated protein
MNAGVLYTRHYLKFLILCRLTAAAKTGGQARQSAALIWFACHRIYSAHIYLGESRIVSKVSRADGEEYERAEYTPYGELWIEKASTASNLDIPYRFTGKERDEETGLYYYGARYLDSRTSRWLSTDPAVGEYVPAAPVNEEARKQNGNLPGMGGVFNVVNLHLYHYAGNNPVKYTDPDGRTDIDFENQTIYANLDDIADLDQANQQLAGFQNTPGYEGFSVVAQGQDGSEYKFDSFASMSEYLETVDPSIITEEEKNRITGGSVMLAGGGIMALSLYGANKAGAQSKDAGPAKGFVLGLQMFLFGATQMVTGKDIMGEPIKFVGGLLKDPRVDVFKAISDFNIKKNN